MTDLPKRKKIRIPGFNYNTPNVYFITICTKDRMNLFWKRCENIPNVGADIIRPQETHEYKLSHIGEIIEASINQISQHYSNVSVDNYCVMPNHIHLLVSLLSDENGRIISAPTSISTIIGQMKRWASKETGFQIWQKSFYEHIIRNEKDYLIYYEYILNNPIKWETDDYYVN